MHHRHFLFAVICAGSLLLSGCGDGRPSFSSGSFELRNGENFILMPRQDSINEPFTYEFWANPIELDEIDSVTFGFENKGYNNQHFVVFPEHGGTRTAGTGVSLGTNYVGVYEHRDNFFNARISHPADLAGWHHYAVVYSNMVPILYIDGEEAGKGVSTGIPVKPLFNLGRVSGRNKAWQGEIAEFRLWSRALSQKEIQKSMREKPSGVDPSLEIYYDFSDKAALPGIPDLSGNGRKGSVNDYALISSVQDTHVTTISGYAKIEEIDMKGSAEALAYAIDRISGNDFEVEIAGWAFIPGRDALAQNIWLLLRGQKDYFFTTETVKRNDLTQMHQNNLDDCGFQAKIKKTDLPPGRYQIWLYVVKQNYFRNFHSTSYFLDIE